MPALLIPYGMTPAGYMIHVDLVARGKACGLTCPSCMAPLVARKGTVKQHHLAHAAGKPTCEGWLHSTAKQVLAQRIESAMADGGNIPIEWTCECGSHQADLLGKQTLNIVAIEERQPEHGIRPDIALKVGSQTKVLIEIVDTHKPDLSVIDTGLPILEVHVSKGEDLVVLSAGTIPVAKMHNYPCPDPYCRTCGNRRSRGCRYCSTCGRHVSATHWYCKECHACDDFHHWHRWCETCHIVVVERELIPNYGGDGDHNHCVLCGVLIVGTPRLCGCCAPTYCRPCYRSKARTEHERAEATQHGLSKQRETEERAERWRAASLEERAEMLSEWRKP